MPTLSSRVLAMAHGRMMEEVSEFGFTPDKYISLRDSRPFLEYSFRLNPGIIAVREIVSARMLEECWQRF